MTTQKKAPVKFETETSHPELPVLKEIAPEELAKRVSDVHIIDVRRPDEYTGELGHIAGSRLLVLQTLPEHIDELPKDEPIVFVCRSGMRSAQATAFAIEHGFQHVYNMKGGMIRWNDLGLPVET